MTRSGDPTRVRGRRGRVLIVGRLPEFGSITKRLAREPVHVSSIYEAIGELYASDAAHPIDAVLVPDSVLDENGRDAVQAMHRVDPAVQLIRVIDGGSIDPDQASQYDDQLETPIDLEALGRILSEGILLEEPRETSQAPQASDEQQTPTSKPTEAPTRHGIGGSTIAGVPSGEASQAANADPDPEPIDQRHAATTSPRSGEMPGRPIEEPAPLLPSGAEPAAMNDAPIGDTDLVDAVLHDPEPIREKALAAIVQHTGWNDIALVGPEDAPSGQELAAVQSVDHDFGVLTSAHADRGELIAWAQWLARWLQLDTSYRAYRMFAYRDDLTGAWNRRYFFRFLDRTIARAARLRRPITVMVFDIDDFKHYNDRFSHEAGDVILRETVALLKSVVRGCDRVCRIGGDEFAVIFADLEGPRELGSEHPASVEAIAKRFQEQVCAMRFPKLGVEARSTLSISAGLATYPWDGHDPMQLLRLADQRALESKRRGKNHITFGPSVANVCPEDEP